VKPTLIITGASGYLGGSVASFFESAGWNVFEFARRQANPARHCESWSLESPPSPDALRKLNAQALIHCAWDFGPTKWSLIEQRNVVGSQSLLHAAAEAGVPSIVFISTISAFTGCRSLYGRAKLAVERTAAQLGASVIRPGLTWGSPRSGGMINSLRASATRPVVPLVDRGQYPQYLLFHEDLGSVLLQLAESRLSFSGPLTLAHPQPWPLHDLILKLAADQGRNPILLPIPSSLLKTLAIAGEALHIPLPFRSDSIVSLVHQDPAPDFETAHRLGLLFRPFGSAPTQSRVVRS